MRKKERLKELIGKVIPYRVNTMMGRFDYWRLKRKALRLHKYFGKQYHIFPIDDSNVTIMDNGFRKEYNQSVQKHQRINFLKLIETAYFSTPSSIRLMK